MRNGESGHMRRRATEDAEVYKLRLGTNTSEKGRIRAKRSRQTLFTHLTGTLNLWQLHSHFGQHGGYMPEALHILSLPCRCYRATMSQTGLHYHHQTHLMNWYGGRTPSLSRCLEVGEAFGVILGLSFKRCWRDIHIIASSYKTCKREKGIVKEMERKN